MKIFVIGGSGLVGSRLSELLKKKYEVDNLSISNGVDITDPETLGIIKNDSKHNIVILIAAKANVDSCESDKTMGENGDAWKINVEGVKNVVNSCRPSSKKLIYISTDFVFDGENTPVNGYKEEDTPNPKNWYAETKYKGEEIVKSSGLPYIIARIAYPYGREFEAKKDFVRAIKDRLTASQPVSAVTDHIMTPTFIDDIAVALDKLIETNSTGTFHISGSQSLTPHESAVLIAEKFGLDKNLIKKTTRAKYFAGKAERPFNVSMNNAKIEKLGVKMSTFEDGLSQLI